MLLVRCFVDTGIVPPLDPRPYSPQWLLHRDEEKFLDIVRRFATEKEVSPGVPAEALAKAGDVIVYRFGRCFAHGAIVLDSGHVIHAWKLEGCVTISPLNDIALTQLASGRPRPRKLFDCWAK